MDDAEVRLRHYRHHHIHHRIDYCCEWNDCGQIACSKLDQRSVPGLLLFVAPIRCPIGAPNDVVPFLWTEAGLLLGGGSSAETAQATSGSLLLHTYRLLFLLVVNQSTTPIGPPRIGFTGHVDVIFRLLGPQTPRTIPAIHGIGNSVVHRTTPDTPHQTDTSTTSSSGIAFGAKGSRQLFQLRQNVHGILAIFFLTIVHQQLDSTRSIL